MDLEPFYCGWGGVSKRRSVAAGSSDRWKVTYDISQKMPIKMAKKCPQVQESVIKAKLHSIGATIRTRRERRCLPYVGFLIF